MEISMTLPNNSSANTVSMSTVETWKTADLNDASKNELSTILSRIKAEAFHGGTQPEKYWAYQPAVTSGNKSEMIKRIVAPVYKTNTYKEVQAKVLEEAEKCVSNRKPQKGWVLRKDPLTGNTMSGNKIEHWLFKKNVINVHFKGGAGNPFTVFKIDSRKDACREMWTRKGRIRQGVCIGRCKQDHEKYLFFRGDFFGHFRDFERNRTNRVDLKKAQTKKMQDMKIAEESQAEGFSTSLLFHLARDEILNFIGVSKSDMKDCIFISAHRRQGSDRQFEFDACFAWTSPGDVQNRTHCETKTRTQQKPDWSAGFSKHQMDEAAEKISIDVVSPNKHIQSLFIRCERNERNYTWTALLDLYDSNSNFVKHLDIYGLPN